MEQKNSFDTTKRESYVNYHIAHCIDRAKERFNLTLSKKDIEAIGELVRNGKSTPLFKQSKVIKHHLLRYKGKDIIVIYHKLQKIPMTLMSEREYKYQWLLKKETNQR